MVLMATRQSQQRARVACCVVRVKAATKSVTSPNKDEWAEPQGGYCQIREIEWYFILCSAGLCDCQSPFCLWIFTLILSFPFPFFF